MPDYDDMQRMRHLFTLYTSDTVAKNKAVMAWTTAEKELCLAIAIYGISDKLAWKKQCIELMKEHVSYRPVWEKYCDGKAGEKLYSNSLKAIENETNVLKKIHEQTPD